MTHNESVTFLFLQDSGPISAKFAAQILSLILAYTFLLLNFLITGLCNSSASCSFTLILPFLVAIAPDPAFLSKTLINHIC